MAKDGLRVTTTNSRPFAISGLVLAALLIGGCQDSNTRSTEDGGPGSGTADAATDAATEAATGTDPNASCPPGGRKATAGTCGCSMPDNDYDQDGTVDCIKQGGVVPPPITSSKLAVIVVDFEDTDPAIRALYPSKADIATRLFDPEEVINQYLRDQSFGIFTGFTGDVFGPFTHPRTIGEIVSSGDYTKPEYADDIVIKTESAIQIPGFDSSEYDGIMLLLLDDYSPNPGGLTGQWTFRINDRDVQVENSTVMALHIGHPSRDTEAPIENDFTSHHDGTVFVPASIVRNGEVTVPHSRHDLTNFDRTYLHELIHAFGIGSHAFSAMDDGKLLTAPAPDSSNYFLFEDYGNLFALMGRSEYSTGLCADYRSYLGWYPEDRKQEIDDFGSYNVALYPVDSPTGVIAVEIRLPFQVNEFFSDPDTMYLNRGYFLEIRSEAVKWDSGLEHEQLIGNTEGIMITYNDGFTSVLLDASPSPYLEYDWGTLPDKRDVVLKTGQQFATSGLKIDCAARADSGFDVSIEVVEEW